MSQVFLVVTEKVIKQVSVTSASQKQIAVCDASADIRMALADVSKDNRKKVVLGGCVELTVGDTGAIWRSHNTDTASEEDFDSLFDLLSRRPNVTMKFFCAIQDPR
jgi:hypothetical protein